MLKPERAREQLREWQTDAHLRSRLQRAAQVSPEVAQAVMDLWACNARGQLQGHYLDQRKAQHAGVLAARDPQLRAQLFAAVFPRLQTTLEAGWQLCARLPYTVGYTRRGFRAPGHEALAILQRRDFLVGVFQSLGRFDDAVLDPDWIAAWAVHLERGDSLGLLLAAALDNADPQDPGLLETLQDCAAARHAIGGPGRFALRALLCCARPAAWAFVGQLLVAAQRQEGLRQSILESIDEAHPDAFEPLLGELIDADLFRFAAVARAAGVWLGEEHHVLEPKVLRDAVLDLRLLLADPAARTEALGSGDAQRCYRALWCLASRDADAAVELTPPMLADPRAPVRMAAAHFLSQCGLPQARALLLPLLDDPHPELLAVALSYLRHGRDYSHEFRDWQGIELGQFMLWHTPGLPVPAAAASSLFQRLCALIPRLPAKAAAETRLVSNWIYAPVKQSDVADLLVLQLGDTPARELLPWLPLMTPYWHAHAIAEICKPGTLDRPLRELLMAAVGHPAGEIREAALEALQKCTIEPAEAVRLEAMLSRSQAEFRRAVFGLLSAREDAAVIDSVARLLGARHALQRAAGIELARQLIQADRAATELRERLIVWRDARGSRLSASEAEAIIQAVARPEKALSRSDCLGLIDPARRTQAQMPEIKPIRLASKAAVALLQSLDALIEQHKTHSFKIVAFNGQVSEELLGSSYNFPDARSNCELPFAELWCDWFLQRPEHLRDADGCELLRAMLHPTCDAADASDLEEPGAEMETRLAAADAAWPLPVESELSAEQTAAQLEAARARLQPLPRTALRYEGLCRVLLGWLLKLFAPARAEDFLLDAMETGFASVPPGELCRSATAITWANQDWRQQQSVFMVWAQLAIAQFELAPECWSQAQSLRLHRLLRWRDQPQAAADPQVQVPRCRPDPHLLLRLHAVGAASIEDVYDDLLGEREEDRGWSYRLLAELSTDSGSFGNSNPPTSSEVRAAADRVRERLLEIELQRGESPTLVTKVCKVLQSIPGFSWLLRVLRALGKLEFRKPEYYVGDSKAEILTHFARVCMPLPKDSEDQFAIAVNAAISARQFPRERLLELALLNPRWVGHVALTLGWPGLAEAVYWFIAHTRNDWQNPHTARHDSGTAQLQAAIKSRTSLTTEQRYRGLVDVSWFHRVYSALADDQRWDTIEAAAKFLGWGMAHRKAARLVDVLLGRTPRAQIVAAIEQRQLKEYVRLLGLLPLPSDPGERKQEIAERHAVLQGYERYARGLSAMSKPDAMQAVQLGFDNLAITAGYSDPLRLQWSVSAHQLADLRDAAASEGHGEVRVSLQLDAEGLPELTCSKAGKSLKSLPAELRKHPPIAALIERRNSLQKLRSASIVSLEQAMCQGTRLVGAEVNELLSHALVRPLLQRLLLVAPAGIGYPEAAGQLRHHDGRSIQFSAGQMLWIAHPLDLLTAGDWPAWQRDCLVARRVQPFKQVFRELYMPTAADLDGSDRVERYAGQQLNPAQANALLASRGWSVHEGVSKLFDSADLVAVLDFEGAMFTPTEVEAPTFGGLSFHRRSDWQRLLMRDVPALLFSECLRDLDLVVSVAHVGGVDPEASQSTIQMRAALLAETCALLGLDNVRIESRHALIQGTLAHYSVHLGSGSVHQQPGGALSIVAVQGQHRGRLFLPFADNDPRTAEILSKALLLARDQQIQDPTVLAQIVRK